MIVSLAWVSILLLAVLIGLGVWAVASGHAKILLGVAAFLVLAFLALFATHLPVRPSRTTTVSTTRLESGGSVVQVDSGRSEVRVRQSDGSVEVNTGRSLARVEAGHEAVPEVLNVGPLRWESPSDLGFGADVFPSKRAAAEFLADRLLADPAAQSWLPGAPNRVYLKVSVPEIEQGMTRAVRRHHPDAEVVRDSSSTRPAGGEGSWLELAAIANSEHLVEMNLRAVADGRPQLAVGSAQVQPKRWVESLAAHAAEAGVDSADLMVVYSNETANGPAAAEREATRLAAEALRPLLASREGWAGSGDPVAIPSPTALVKDRFVQNLHTPSGQQVTRVALLIDRSEPALKQFTGECQLQARLAQERQLANTRYGVGKWLAVGVLAVFVMVLGLGVNAITRGYYRGAVVGVALLAIVALGVLAKFSGLIVPHG